MTQFAIEFLVGATLVLVIATIDALQAPVAVVLIVVGAWTVGKWTLYGLLSWYEQRIRDEVERGKR